MTILCLSLVLVGATGCTGPKWLAWLPWIDAEEETQEQTPITCSIQFAETVDEKYQPIKLYEGDQFEINTKIYVIVDFTMINYGSEDDYLEFKIQIPYAKYYSTYEYNKGVIAPKEEQTNFTNDDGIIESMIVLSKMEFRVKTGQIPFHYTYCFTIEANSVCDNVEFKAVFEPSKEKIIISEQQTFSKTYSFVDNNGGEQE